MVLNRAIQQTLKGSAYHNYRKTTRSFAPNYNANSVRKRGLSIILQLPATKA